MQKFKRGDLVRIAKDLGPSMSHFTADALAVVVGSYKDQYGGGREAEKSYTLHIQGRGPCSWYHEHQLTLVKKGTYPKFKDYCEGMFNSVQPS